MMFQNLGPPVWVRCTNGKLSEENLVWHATMMSAPCQVVHENNTFGL
jgi:hypothetical protein